MKIINEAEIITRGVFNNILTNTYNTNRVLDEISNINKTRVKDIINKGIHKTNSSVFRAKDYTGFNNVSVDGVLIYKVWEQPIDVYDAFKKHNLDEIYKDIIIESYNLYNLRGNSVGSLVYNTENNKVHMKLTEESSIIDNSIRLFDLLLESSILSEKEFKKFENDLYDAMRRDGISENIINGIRSDEKIVINYLLATLNLDDTVYRKYSFDNYQNALEAHKDIDYNLYKSILNILNVNMYSFINMTERDILSNIKRKARLDIFKTNVARSDIFETNISSDITPPIQMYKMEEREDIFSLLSTYSVGYSSFKASSLSDLYIVHNVNLLSSYRNNKNSSIKSKLQLSLTGKIIKKQQKIINLLKEPLGYALLNIESHFPDAKGVHIYMVYEEKGKTGMSTKEIDMNVDIDKAFQIKSRLSGYRYDNSKDKYNVLEMKVSYNEYTITLDDYFKNKDKQLISSDLMYLYEFDTDMINQNEYKYYDDFKDIEIIYDSYDTINDYGIHVKGNTDKWVPLLYLKKNQGYKKGKAHYVFLTKKALSTSKVTITEKEYRAIIKNIISIDEFSFNISSTKIDKLADIIKKLFSLYSDAKSDMDIFIGLIVLDGIESVFPDDNLKVKVSHVNNLISSIVDITKRNHFILNEDEILFIG